MHYPYIENRFKLPKEIEKDSNSINIDITESSIENYFKTFNNHMKEKLMISEIVKSHDKMHKELTTKFLNSGAKKSRYEEVVTVIKHKNMKFKIWIGTTMILEKNAVCSEVIYENYKLNISLTSESNDKFKSLASFTGNFICTNTVIFNGFENRKFMEETIKNEIPKYFKSMDEFLETVAIKINQKTNEIRNIDNIYNSLTNTDSDDTINVLIKLPFPLI